ncbi:MAG TPA: hypothetical protein VG247_17925 [Pseudonocardiaceae bacterium]|jgi:hypothetical protein|nr:hypothetical protein [Pseudonocardiaceae bacterium]
MADATFVEARDAAAVSQGTGNQAAKMDGSAGNLVKAAGGGFKLDPHAAASLAAACQAAMDEIRTMSNDLLNIQNAPKLGSLNGAQTVSTYTKNVATDPQGMVQAVQSLNATLQQMHDAYIQASKNYQETNEQVADILKKIDPNGSPSTPAGSTTPANPSSTAANQNISA